MTWKEGWASPPLCTFLAFIGHLALCPWEYPFQMDPCPACKSVRAKILGKALTMHDVLNALSDPQT